MTPAPYKRRAKKKKPQARSSGALSRREHEMFEVLGALSVAWKLYPELSLPQIIARVTKTKDFWEMADSDLAHRCFEFADS